MPRKVPTASASRSASSLAPSPGDVAAVWVDVASLTPWLNNPRRNDDAVAVVARSIDKFGFGAPLVVQHGSGRVIAGHTRLAAARSLGLQTVPVRFLDVDDAAADALALADNRTGEIATWDDDKLRDVVAGLNESNAELLAATGFSDAELRALLNESTARVVDDKPTVDDATEWHLMLTFPDEASLQQAFELAKERGWDCKIIE